MSPEPLSPYPSRRQLLAGVVVLALVLIGLWITIKQMDSPWEGRYRRLALQNKELKFDDLIHVQLWWAFYVDRIIIGALLLLSPLWLRWSQKTAARLSPTPSRTRWWWFVSIMLLALVLRGARMDRGLERDEQDTLRRDILGFYVTNEDGSEDYRLPPWSETMWEDNQANNPFLFSLTAKAALMTWQRLADKDEGQANRIVLRLPAIIPGLISLAALWWWLRRMNLQNAADIALLMGAVHPMHIDYSTQARGYAFVIMFTSLALGAAWLALREGRWRHWAALCACFLGSLYSNPGSIYFCGALGLALGIGLVFKSMRQAGQDARADLIRFLVCGLIAAAIYLPLILPALPQALDYLKTFKGALDGPWPLQTLSKYFVGVMMPAATEYGNYTKPDHELETWDYFARDYLHSEHLLLITVFLVVPALMAAGARRLIAMSRDAIPLVLAGIGAPLTAYLYHRSENTQFLYYWYLIYALPVVIALTGAGLEDLGEITARRWSSLRSAPYAPATVYLFLFLLVNNGGPGRMSLFPGSATTSVTFKRGKFDWVTGLDGRTHRLLAHKTES